MASAFGTGLFVEKVFCAVAERVAGRRLHDGIPLSRKRDKWDSIPLAGVWGGTFAKQTAPFRFAKHGSSNINHRRYNIIVCQAGHSQPNRGQRGKRGE